MLQVYIINKNDKYDIVYHSDNEERKYMPFKQEKGCFQRILVCMDAQFSR